MGSRRRTGNRDVFPTYLLRATNGGRAWTPCQIVDPVACIDRRRRDPEGRLGGRSRPQRDTYTGHMRDTFRRGLVPK
jgi:hypothetical protein